MNDLYKIVEKNKDYKWHYLKDFEIPCDSNDVLVAVEHNGYDVVSLSGDIWYGSDFTWNFTEIIAWKYIEKP